MSREVLLVQVYLFTNWQIWSAGFEETQAFAIILGVGIFSFKMLTKFDLFSHVFLQNINVIICISAIIKGSWVQVVKPSLMSYRHLTCKVIPKISIC